MNRFTTMTACFALALPMMAAAEHAGDCSTLRVTVTPKAGYICYTKSGRWLGNYHILPHVHEKHFTLKPGDSKKLDFDVNYHGGRASMSFICKPVDGSQPKKTTTIKSAVWLKYGQSNVLPYNDDGWTYAKLSKSSRGPARAVSWDTPTDVYGSCSGPSAITWEIGG